MSEETPSSMNSNDDPKTDSESIDKTLSENIKSRPIWLRAFFMLVVLFIWGLSRFVTCAVIVIQFFCVLFTSEPNANLKKFGAQLATYSAEIVRYLTFNTDVRPFPFDAKWPED